MQAPKKINPQLGLQYEIILLDNDVEGIVLNNEFYPTMMGLEFEYYFSPDFRVRRSLSEKKLPQEAEKIAALITEQVLPEAALFHKRPFRDFSNIEWAFNPFSLSAFREFSETMKNFFHLLETVGFVTDNNGIIPTGLHISLDANTIGTEQLRKIFYLIFALDETYIDLSGRKGFIDKLADFRSMIFDETSFHSIVNNAVRSFDNDIYFEYLGMRFGSKKNNTIQFTHFASTLDVGKVLSYMELVEALVQFSLVTKHCSANEFISFVQQNRLHFPCLLLELETTTLKVKNERRMKEIFGV